MDNFTAISPSSKLDISYGFAPTEFTADCLVAYTNEGICFLAFANDNDKFKAVNELKECWRNASFKEDIPGAKSTIDQIFSQKQKNYNLIVCGSDFQIKVWQFLMRVPGGTTISYEEMALKVGGKNYTRATASAIAKNNISYLIPCHRIVSKTGNMHKYHWGSKVKEQLIKWESIK